MARRLPPLLALRAFEAVGRTGSITAAADELCVTHSVVSRHVSRLQADLGVKLLVPHGRSVALTENGRTYLERISRAFDLIARATAEQRPAPSGKLDIRCIPGLANRILLRHLAALEARLPGTEITLQPTLAQPDLARGEADAEIIYAEDFSPPPAINAEVIIRPRVFPVASPAFINRLGPVLAADLPALPLIHEESTSQWQNWLEAAGVRAPATLKGTRLWHAHLAIEAARLGQGVALANEVLAGDDLASGALVEVGQSAVWLGGYYLAAAQARWGDRDISAIRDWLHGLFPAVRIVPQSDQSRSN